MNTSQVPRDGNDLSNVALGKNHHIIELAQLSKSFGGIKALSNVAFSLDEGSIVSIIGPNGAGKSTLINVVTGIYRPLSGEVYFQGQSITGLPAEKIASLGISRTFQFVELFPSLSVLENAMAGCHNRGRAGIFAVGFRLPSARREEKRIRDEAIENLKMVGLEHRIYHSISSLPLGERKLLGIARALGLKPRLLMLDEPAAGLATHEVSRLAALIHELRETGITIVIIEHNMPFVMSISERVIVLNQGEKIADGVPDAIKSNAEVIKAYLGEEASTAENNIPAEVKKGRRRADNCQLEFKDVCTFYGEAQALNEVSLSVNAREIVALIGSNGAGKTTLLKTLTGILPPRYGEILFQGESIKGRAPDNIIRKGIASVPEGRELFGPMSVSDNLLLGAYSLSSKQRREIFQAQSEAVFSMFPILREKLGQKAETLSGGEQQMLAVGRALIPSPKLLALDEPSLGLSPILISEMMDALKQICHEHEVAMLLVEQNAKAALRIADYVYVLERGKIVLEGSREEIMADPKIYAAYLGG